MAESSHSISAYRMVLPLKPNRVVRACLVADWPALAGDQSVWRYINTLPLQFNAMTRHYVSDRYVALAFPARIPRTVVDMAVRYFAPSAVIITAIEVAPEVLEKAESLRADYADIASFNSKMPVLQEVFDALLPER